MVYDLRGVAVVHKPPDWEVDGKARANKENVTDDCPLALSAWLRTALESTTCPVPWCADMDFGFLHRLDVPSSGLILCGTTFTGLMSLRWQLDTYRVERQYTVFGHHLASSQLQVVIANIDPATIDSLRSFVHEVRGKPAKTHLKVSAHFGIASYRNARLEEDAESCSTFVIRIRTGRRHQIRAHLLFSDHATIVDCKYATKCIFFPYLAMYERAYLKAGCPD